MYAGEITNMQTKSCASCGKTVDEAQASWDEALKSGMCPYCRTFYDAERALKFLATAQSPEWYSKVQSTRKRYLLTAVVYIPLGLAILWVLGAFLSGLIESVLGIPFACWLLFVGVRSAISATSLEAKDIVYAEEQQKR